MFNFINKLFVPEFKFALREDITDDSFLPTKAEELSTGYDVRACFYDKIDLIIQPFDYFKIPLGFRMFAPDGWGIELHPRSSSFIKKSMHNLIGIIDESYFFEIFCVGQFIPKNSYCPLVIKYGEKIAQIIPAKKAEMKIQKISNKIFDDLCVKKAVNRTGGFGSTG